MPKSKSRDKKRPESVPARVLQIFERMEQELQSGDEGGRVLVEVALAQEEIESEVRLPVLARDQLRRKLRKHPKLSRHVTRPDAINDMSKHELLALAKKLGVNTNAMIDRVTESGGGMEAVLEEHELERWRHSKRSPAFKGEYPLNLTFEINAQRVTRPAKVEYRFTPEWPYYDQNKRAAYQGWPATIMSLRVLTEPEEYDDGGQAEPSAWVQFDHLLQEGVIPSEIIDGIRNAIDEQCRKEDEQRREAAASKPTSIIDAAMAEGRMPTEREILDEQRRLFREKFGRDLGPGDPVFFDPDQDQPTRWSEDKVTAGILEAMRNAGTPPEIVFAYRRTGRLLVEGMTQADPAVWQEWNDAIAEYFELERKAKNEDGS